MFTLWEVIELSLSTDHVVAPPIMGIMGPRIGQARVCVHSTPPLRKIIFLCFAPPPPYKNVHGRPCVQYQS